MGKIQKIFKSKLKEKEYLIAPLDSADYVAFVSYGMDGRTKVTKNVRTPKIGVIGGGTQYHSGTVSTYRGGYGRYSGTSYSMPRIGVTGSKTRSVSYEVHTRKIAMDIVTSESVKNDTPNKVYEGHVVSEGYRSSFVQVADEMIDALFQKFPDGSGKVEIVSIADC